MREYTLTGRESIADREKVPSRTTSAIAACVSSGVRSPPVSGYTASADGTASPDGTLFLVKLADLSGTPRFFLPPTDVMNTRPTDSHALEDRRRALPPYSSEWYDQVRMQLGEAACRQLGFYAIPQEYLLSVVIPVYNERETLLALLENVRRVPIRKEIVLVDDASTDGTRDLLKDLERQVWDDAQNRLAIYYHDQNRGKGAAVRTGFSKARGDAVIIQDADLEYDPAEIPRLLQPIIEDRADVVFGSRFLGDQPHRVLYFWHYAGNKFLTMLSNCFTNLNLTDMETCYKLFRREVIEAIGPAVEAGTVRYRAGIDRPRGTAEMPGVRDVDQLPWPDLRPGQEDRPARWVSGPVVHRALWTRGLKSVGRDVWTRSVCPRYTSSPAKEGHVDQDW